MKKHTLPVLVVLAFFVFGLWFVCSWKPETYNYSLFPRLNEEGELVYDTIWAGPSGNEVWAQNLDSVYILPSQEKMAFWQELRDSVRKWMFFWQDSVWNLDYWQEIVDTFSLIDTLCSEPDWGFGIPKRPWFFDDHICLCSDIPDSLQFKCICSYCNYADAFIDSLLKKLHKSKGYWIVED